MISHSSQDNEDDSDDETQEKKTHYLYNDVLPQEMAQEVKEPELMKQMFNLQQVSFVHGHSLRRLG